MLDVVKLSNKHKFPSIGEMMNNYYRIKQADWRSWLIPYAKILLHWGWFVVLSIILTTLCSSFLHDIPSANSYQATLQVQLSMPNATQDALVATTTAFSDLFTSPNTLSLVLPKHPELQLSDLEGLVSATPLANTNLILLNTLGDTPQGATTLTIDVYQALVLEINTTRSLVVNELDAALQAELKQCENDLATSTVELQNISAMDQESSSQYQLLNILNTEQQNRVTAISKLLVTLEKQRIASNDTTTLSSNSPDLGDETLTLNNNTPVITTVAGTEPTQSQRIGLSPLVGLIMGVGGVLLASRFSNSLSLRGQRRKMVLPHIIAVIPAMPELRENRLQVLKQMSSQCLTLLRRLRYQASEYEKRLQMITITSPKGREGKSTIATSLAIASAQSGLRTLLVDANPQRPVLHLWFGLPNTTGTLDSIRSLAAGMNDPAPLLNTFTMKLSLLPIGYLWRKGPSALLHEPLRVDGLRSLIELLRNQADVIIFDAPSLLNDAGAANLVMTSDAVLVVVDAQRSQSTTVLEAEELLSRIGVSFSTVLNRARPESIE